MAWPSPLLLLFLLGGLFVAALGAILLLSPAEYRRLAVNLAERRRTGTGLRMAIHIERYFYRHHRISGGLIVLAALVYLLLVPLQAPDQWPAALLGGMPAALALLIDGLLLVSHVMAALIGLIVFLRPSALKPLESRINDWLRAGGNPMRGPDAAQRWMPQAPRLGGALMLASGLLLAAAHALLLAQIFA